MLMAKIDSQIINDIRNKIDIVDVVSSYLKLETRGKNYFGICPFHDDHTPSMSVSRDKQIYTCFTCGATGNVFKFIQDYEHISFVESVKKCADIVGISLDIKINNEDSINTKYKELYDIYNISQKFYQNNINSTLGKEAKKYLYDRKLTDNEIKKFEIGLSLNEFDFLTKLLKQKKYSEKDMLKSGLVNANDNGLHDVYRNRIMFPLQDINGHVIGYNGRAYQGNITNKYVNSKETDIFKKRDYLYNYHRAKESARIKKEIIIMEGPMDVIRASTIGIDNVVAALGTSFSSAQASLIKRLSSNVIICFDGDEAGLKGTKLAIKELHSLGINPKIVRLPNNADPDEYIKLNGKDKFIEQLNNAYNIMEFKELLLKKDINFNNAEDLSKYVKTMIDEINSIDDDILREITINKLIEDTKIDKKIILDKIEKKDTKEIVLPKKRALSRNKYEKSLECLFYYMLHFDDAIKLYDKKITYIDKEDYRHLGFQINAFYKQNGYISVADLLTELHDDEEAVKTIGKIMTLGLPIKYNEEAIIDYLNNIQEYNEKMKETKFIDELKKTNDINTKLELGLKAIERKLRSEKNDR